MKGQRVDLVKKLPDCTIDPAGDLSDSLKLVSVLHLTIFCQFCQFSQKKMVFLSFHQLTPHPTLKGVISCRLRDHWSVCLSVNQLTI